MTDILPLLKPLSPYIPQALAVLLIGALIFFRTFSREKEILSRMDKLSNTIENLYKKLETENEKIAQKIEDVNEKYHNIEKKALPGIRHEGRDKRLQRRSKKNEG